MIPPVMTLPEAIMSLSRFLDASLFPTNKSVQAINCDLFRLGNNSNGRRI